MPIPFNSRTLRHWTQRADAISRAELQTVAAQQTEARALRAQLERLIGQADTRLRAAAQTPSPLPVSTDWSWRPDLWATEIWDSHDINSGSKTELDSHVTLFHDCASTELISQQTTLNRSKSGPAFALDIRVFHFDGTFLSLAVDLPPEGSQGLGQNHVLQVDLDLETETPLELFGRLNVKHGPNTEQLVLELDQDAKEQRFEFDLAYANLRERPVDRVWVDLIFERPRMNRIVLRDLAVSRHRRAAM